MARDIHIQRQEITPCAAGPDADAAPPKEPMPAAGSWVLLATILASSMAFIDGTALNVALPVIQRELDATGAQLLWTVNGYLLMLGALILVCGVLGDRFGRKRVFSLGIGLFTLASIACGSTPGINFLIGARVVQGIGGAMMIPGSLAIITAFFGPESRGRAIGTWAAVTTMVTVIGPMLGGALAGAGLWRGVFFINTPLAVAALVILRFRVPESRDTDAATGIDFAGAFLAVAGLASLTYGFIAAPDYGFGNPRIDGALLLGVAALGAFAGVEAAGSHPMMPLRLFRSRTFSGANLLTLLLYGAISVSTFFLSLNFVQVQGYTPFEAGLAFMPFALILAGMSRWAGGLVDRYGARLPLIAGPAIAGAGFLLLGVVGLTSGPEAYWHTYLPGVVLFGIGMGVTVAPLSTAVMGSLSQRHAGTASGVNNAVSRIAGVLAIAVLGSFMLFYFASALSSRTSALPISAEARAAINDQAGRLAEAGVPPQVGAGNADAVRRAIRRAFVDSLRRLMFICAGMAWASSAIAALMVRRRLEAMD